MRTGVPVFIRSTRKPMSRSCSVIPVDAGSLIRPPGHCVRPTCINPLRNVPAVRMTARAENSAPRAVRTPPTAFPPSDVSSIKSSLTLSCHMVRWSVFSRILRHRALNLMRSLCARGLHMAGPFERLSILNCNAVSSVTIPIMPPRASISRTIWPLAMPPTAGLQLICAILFMSIVISSVSAPNRADACAASHPACPAPMTITSNCFFISKSFT